MAIFNEILTGSLSDVLAKRLGMQTGSPSPSLAPEVMPVLALEVDRPEWHALGRSVLASGGSAQTADAANLSAFRFVNPASSGTLVVVEAFQVVCTGNCNLRRYSSVIAALVNAIATVPRDTRIATPAPTRNTVASFSRDNQAAISPGGFLLWTIAANQSAIVDLPIILAPGTSLEFATAAVNTALTVNMRWRERALVQGELI